ncbi:MAG: multiheme c-type cytochrome [Thermodesulfobacteriota bacterium]
MKNRKIIWVVIFIIFTIFMLHRFTRQLNFFEISEEFERPKAISIPAGLGSVSATTCGLCHKDIYEEWKTSMHANSWKDPYFQADFKFDGSQQICINCHAPLENQQENLVLGFKGDDKFDPILKPNPDFDRSLQQEGVTCAVCHIEEGVILGPHEISTGAHQVRKDSRFTDGNGVCRRCHSVKGDRWDVFLKLPPCGNFAEIEETGIKINCVKCHMPRVKRAMAIGAQERIGGRHLWRGGHDQEMVKKAIKIELKENTAKENKKVYVISLTNIGAEHRLPTGTPDRHLKVAFKLLDENKNVLKEKTIFLQRTILWRPFIIDLWDTRLKYKELRSYSFEFMMDGRPQPAFLDVKVEYGLLREKRRLRIGYQNVEPITYELFHKTIKLSGRQ